MPGILDILEAPGQEVIITAGSGDYDRDEWFEQVCEIYPEAARIEMDSAGNIIVTPFNSEDSGYRSGEAFAQLRNWARRDRTGRAFDASTIFNLPNGAKRSPDAAWVSKEVLRAEGAATQRATKTRHVPRFLIEVASPSDRVKDQRDKCREWIENGAEEAILLVPQDKTAYIFRSGSDEPLIVPNAMRVESAALSGFVLDCEPVWEDLV